MMMRLPSLGILTAAVVLILDQLSKAWVIAFFRPEGVSEIPFGPVWPVDLTPFLRLVMTWNTGVSFGIFNDGTENNVWILSSLAMVVCIALLVWLWQARKPLIAVALGGIIGGALGNVIDRLRFGAVADFVDVHAFGYHWPAFNIADSAITVGAVLLVADSLLRKKGSADP